MAIKSVGGWREDIENYWSFFGLKWPKLNFEWNSFKGLKRNVGKGTNLDKNEWLDLTTSNLLINRSIWKSAINLVNRGGEKVSKQIDQYLLKWKLNQKKRKTLTSICKEGKTKLGQRKRLKRIINLTNKAFRKRKGKS